jgi:hypothetical protein
MTQQRSIQYLTGAQIDRAQWDRCLEQATNGLIYANSWYLDAMTGQWDALVLGDYEAVMPLPWRSKYGIRYLYQPFLTAQLGVFGKNIDAALVKDFFESVPKNFRFWDMSLNHGNLFSIAGYPLKERVNFVLDLKPDYEALQKNFRENIRRNIRKSAQYGNRIRKDIQAPALVDLARLHARNVTEEDFTQFISLFDLLAARNSAVIYGVESKHGELLASAAFFFSHNRACYILVGNHPNGRTLGASHALIDAFIRDHAGTGLILDFEGSDVRNLAFFYGSFGAVQENYAAIVLNRLPWFARWMKK